MMKHLNLHKFIESLIYFQEFQKKLILNKKELFETFGKIPTKQIFYSKKFYIIDHSNNWIYNIFDPLEFCFYSFIYYRLLSDKKNKKLILLSTHFAIKIFKVNTIQQYYYLKSCFKSNL